MSKRKYQLERLSFGYCANCGHRPVKRGCTWCVHCLREKARTALDTAADRRSRGVCPDCGKSRPLPGYRSCRRCTVRRRLATRRYKARLRSDGNGHEE